MATTKCYRCKGDMIILGALYSGMRTSFRPQDSKFLTLETGDVNKLRRLTSEPDAETAEFANTAVK